MMASRLVPSRSQSLPGGVDDDGGVSMKWRQVSCFADLMRDSGDYLF